MYRLTNFLVRFLHCVGIIILGTGCTTTHEFVSPGVIEEGKKSRIIRTDGEMFYGKNIEIGVDSLSCLESDSRLVICIPQSEVKEIRTKDHVRGALLGCLLGTGAGILLGRIVGDILVGEESHNEDASGYVWESIIIIIGGAGGGVIGLIWGLDVGHTSRYIIDSSQQNQFVRFKP